MPLGGVSQYVIQLYVSINHIASPRQAQGGIEPNLVGSALICERAGCDGITIHLQEDRHHIQDKDVFAIKEAIQGKLNLEITLSDEMISFARKAEPHKIIIVPDKRDETATEGGLDIRQNMFEIKDTVKLFHDHNIPVSLLVEPDIETVELAKESGTDFIEIHAGRYCSAAEKTGIDQELARIYNAATYASKVGIKIAAGRGLNYKNVGPVLNTRGLLEVHIGRAIAERSAAVGLAWAVGEMLDILE